MRGITAAPGAVGWRPLPLVAAYIALIGVLRVAIGEKDSRPLPIDDANVGLG